MADTSVALVPGSVTGAKLAVMFFLRARAHARTCQHAAQQPGRAVPRCQGCGRRAALR